MNWQKETNNQQWCPHSLWVCTGTITLSDDLHASLKNTGYLQYNIHKACVTTSKWTCKTWSCWRPSLLKCFQWTLKLWWSHASQSVGSEPSPARYMDLLVCTFYKSVETDWNSKGKFAKSVGMYYESDSTDLHVTFLSWSLDKYFVWKEVHLQFFY